MQSNQLRQPSMIGAPVSYAIVGTAEKPAGSGRRPDGREVPGNLLLIIG